MAGYTSRLLFTLTIPSIFGFLSVLWFLKKKNSSSKQVNRAIQVEDITLTDKESYLVLSPMKLKNEEGNPNKDPVSSTEMQLKEAPPASEKQTQHCNGVSHQHTKVKGKKKGKSKLRENGTTCLSSEPIANGGSKDIKHCEAEDSSAELTNGIAALSLGQDVPAKDEVFAQVKNSVDMEISNDSSLHNGSSEDVDSSSQSSTHAVVPDEKIEQDTLTNIDNEKKTQENGFDETAKEECDTDNIQISNDRNSLIEEKEIKKTDELTTEVVQNATNEPLTLPVDCAVAGTQGDMLESPGAKYCDSEGSNDSGKGGSEFQFVLEQQVCLVYEFEILQELCGLLIGRNGRHVNYIKQETNANILIKRHPFFTHKKICSVTGAEDEIHAALKLIRKRFPVEIYPSVTLSQINLSLPLELPLPDVLKLCLPEGVSFEAMLCATVNAGHFFLQQPTHPTFHSLPALTAQMSASYSQVEAPTLSHVAKGYVCAASLTEGWFRAEVDEVFPDTDECRLKFLDYGGYAVVPRSSLRQIRYDFMQTPFQATECYLGSVTFPEGETGWSAEATAAFEELAQGQIVQGYIVDYAENRVPYVHLYKITGATSIFISRELVSRGLATWITSHVN